MEEKKYTCFTDKGSWEFYAENDVDAMRKALYFSWRDGEEFENVQTHDYPSRCLRITRIYSNGAIETL